MWLLDLTRGVATDITQSPQQHSDATWSPNGERLAFRHGNQVVTRPANGGALTVVADRLGYPEAWSADGRYLIMGVPGSAQRGIRARVDRSHGAREAGDDRPRQFRSRRATVLAERQVGDLQRRRAGPARAGVRDSVSADRDSGISSRRRRDAGAVALAMAASSTTSAPTAMLMAVPVPEGDIRRALPPVPLFRAGLETSATFDQFAPSADGQRFLVRRPPEGGGDRAPVNIIVNFDLRRALAVGGERR